MFIIACQNTFSIFSNVLKQISIMILNECALTSITFMGNELHLQDDCSISCELIGLSPVSRQSASRPCKTKQRT